MLYVEAECLRSFVVLALVSGGPGRTRPTIISGPGRTRPTVISGPGRIRSTFGRRAIDSTFVAFFRSHGNSYG